MAIRSMSKNDGNGEISYEVNDFFHYISFIIEFRNNQVYGNCKSSYVNHPMCVLSLHDTNKWLTTQVKSVEWLVIWFLFIHSAVDWYSLRYHLTRVNTIEDSLYCWFLVPSVWGWYSFCVSYFLLLKIRLFRTGLTINGHNPNPIRLNSLSLTAYRTWEYYLITGLS